MKEVLGSLQGEKRHGPASFGASFFVVKKASSIPHVLDREFSGSSGGALNPKCNGNFVGIASQTFPFSL